MPSCMVICGLIFLERVNTLINEKMISLGKNSSVIRKIFEYGKKRKSEIGEENVFDFSIGNPSVPTPKAVTNTMEDLLKNQCPVALHGYTSAPGDMNVRRSIADNLAKRFGADISPDLIYMTCGAAASLTITLNAIVNDGDEIIVLAPFFPEYRVFVEKAGGKLVVVPPRKDTFSIDFAALKNAITDKTKAIIINSPNNPSGVVYSEQDIKKIGELLNGIYIISDEPYRELAYDVKVPFIPNLYSNTIVCYSYSKSLSLPGERIGYIAVPDSVYNARELYSAICGAGRSLGYVCAPSILQYTVGKCVDVMPDLTVYRKNRDLLYNSLTEFGYTAVRPDGAFYLFLKSPEPDAKAFCEKAKKYELLLVPSDSFGVDGYVRVSYCVSTEMIEKALPQFKKLINEYK